MVVCVLKEISCNFGLIVFSSVSYDNDALTQVIVEIREYRKTAMKKTGYK